MTNELLEQIRKKNDEEQIQHELKRQAALKKVRQLREQLRKRNENLCNSDAATKR